uniref:Putative conserved secreted protein n=1 Tax=Rhipicephalus microplus TaxID=6941 RepID=A0A6M2D634_RHIMP
MRGVALAAVCLLGALVRIEAGGGGYGGGAVAVATPVITQTTPILIAASKPALPSIGHSGHYLGYAGNVFEQLLRFSGHYGLPRGGGGGGKGLLGAVSLPVYSGNLVLGHGHGGGGGGRGGAFLLGHGGGFGGGSLKTYKLAQSSYGIPVGLPVSLAHGWH